MKTRCVLLPLAAALLLCGGTPAPESTAPAPSTCPEAATLAELTDAGPDFIN